MSSTPDPGKEAAREARRQHEAMWPYEEPLLQQQVARGQFGESFYPGLRSFIESSQVDPAFDFYMQDELDTLRGNLAITGSPSSGPAQTMAARIMSDRASGAMSPQIAAMLQAAGMQGTNTGDAAAAGRSAVAALSTGGGGGPNMGTQIGGALFGGGLSAILKGLV